MKMKRGGVIFDVVHPSEIARLKKAGFKEVVETDFAAEQQAIVEATTGTGSQVVDETAAPKKGKGK